MNVTHALLVFLLVLVISHVTTAKTYTFPSNSKTCSESSGVISVEITRTGDVSKPATVTIVAAETGTNAATINEDCKVPGSVDFEAQQKSTMLKITILQDTKKEGDETFALTLSPNDGGTTTPIGEMIIVIEDDDDEVTTQASTSQASTSQASTSYNCLRNGQECKNSAQCVSGTCDCASLTPAYGGYDCTYKVGDTSNGACAETTPHDCGSNAQCYDTGSGPNCFCDVGFVEDDSKKCTVPRYRVACTKKFMILTATPAGNFGGDIYIKGKYGVEECKFTKQDDDYSLQLNNVGSKCDDAVVDDLGKGESKVKRTFRVDYDKTMNTMYDETVNVECNTTDTMMMSHTISSVKVEPSSLTQVSGSGKLNVVKLEMSNANGDAVTPTTKFNVGDQITFKLSVNSDSYAGLVLLSMAVDNNMNAPKTLSSTLVTAKCVDPNTKLIVHPGPVHPSNNVREVVVAFRMMKFKTSSSIRLRFKSQICDSSPEECKKQCSSRGERAAAGKTETNDMSVLLTVNSPHDSANSESTKEKVCVPSTSMVTAIAALSVVIVILLVICLVLFARGVTRETAKY